MKKNVFKIILIISLPISVFLGQYFYTKNSETYGDEIKKKNINDVVIKKDLPISYHHKEVLYLKNGDEIVLEHSNIKMYNKIAIGDSISKKSGSLTFYIFKNKMLTDTIQYIDFRKK